MYVSLDRVGIYFALLVQATDSLFSGATFCTLSRGYSLGQVAKLTLLDMRAQGAGGGAPIDATFITQTPSGTLTNEQALSLLATGLLKGTTGTGVVSIAVQGADYYAPGDLAAVAVSGDYGDLLNLPTLGTMAAFNDAPSDGSTYGRNNGAWAVVAAGVSPPFVDETPIVYKTGNVAITQTHDIDAYTVARVVTWPDAALTVAGKNIDNQFSVSQNIIASGADIYLGITRTGGKFCGMLAGLSGSTFQYDKTGSFFIHAADTVSDATILSTHNLTFTGTGTARGRLGINNTAPGGLIDAFVSSTVRFFVSESNGYVGIKHNTPLAPIHPIEASASTNVVSNVAILGHNTTGTPVAGYGTGLLFQGESSTTIDQNMARIASAWQTATHATAVADIIAQAYYNNAGTFTASEIWRGRAGAAPLFGVLGATPVARQAHIADPSGGGTQDAEARTAINAILVVLENFGFVATS